MSYDWNQNGRQDSFDRYMDYHAAHPERNGSNSQSNYNGDYFYNDTFSMDGREKVPYYMQLPLIMIKMQPRQNDFMQACKIRCTLQSMGTQQQSL